MIKILFLSSSYPSHKEDVHSMFMRDLTESIAEQNYQVFVLCPHQRGLPFHEIQNNINIIRFPYWFTLSGQRLTQKGGITSSLSQSRLAYIQVIPFCICQLLIAWKTVRSERIDLIHSHWIVPQGLVGAFLRFFTGIPHIASVHGTDIHLIHSYPLAYPVVRMIAEYSDYITTNSSHTCNLVRKIIPGRVPRVIPMGINPDEFTGFRTQKRGQNILFVGRLITLKGVHYLITAIKIVKSHYPQVKLIIIGDGPNKSEFEELSLKLNLSSNISFVGRMNRKNLLSFYENADIFVLPSIPYHDQTEGLGVVLLEAMASGVPVIGSNTGGIPDIIKDGVNGLLVPPGDSQALAEAIICILENPELASRFREAGLETVKERFTWDVITDQFMAVYQKTLNTDGNIFKN